ncbi:MAG: FIST N-terminal domain-containing protein [Pseudomonadota bacterium]
MEDLPFGPAGVEGKSNDSAFLIAEASVHDPSCVQIIVERLASVELAHVLVFASPDGDFASLMRALGASFACPVIGCTTAGEIGSDGYVTGQVIALGFPAHSFAARTILITDLSRTKTTAVIDDLVRARIAVQATNPDKKNGFSFMMVDGLSRSEDALVSAVSSSLSGFPLFGGSAGDGLRFESSYIAFGDQIYQDAATITFVATDCETQVFSTNHMRPGGDFMVVTEADPERRVVKSINAEPAAAEYARIIGKDPAQLDELVFAGHPVAVSVGGQYHVRAIQRVNEDGDLVFFSAIDEGMVLTVATAGDMAHDLDAKLQTVRNGHRPPAIIGCDCVLRRIEAERGQTTHKVNEVLRRHNVVGFSTYGEQIGTLHVNHTMTGVAIFPNDGPGDGRARD